MFVFVSMYLCGFDVYSFIYLTRVSIVHSSMFSFLHSYVGFSSFIIFAIPLEYLCSPALRGDSLYMESYTFISWHLTL